MEVVKVGEVKEEEERRHQESREQERRREQQREKNGEMDSERMFETMVFRKRKKTIARKDEGSLIFCVNQRFFYAVLFCCVLDEDVDGVCDWEVE